MTTLRILSVCICVALLSFTTSTEQKPTGKLTGKIGLYSGNMMPSPGHKSPGPSPLSTTVYITEPSFDYDEKKLIDSTVSDKNGFYEIDLPPGKYSLFMKNGDEYHCDSWRNEGSSGTFCTPFIIEAGKTTTVNANVDNAAW